jgi:hypothetical protein
MVAAIRTQTCPMCRASFDPLQGKYAPDGTIVCSPCGTRLGQARAAEEKKNASSTFVGALGAVFIALFSFAFQLNIGPLSLPFLLPLVAMGCGGATAYPALRNGDVILALGWKRIPTIVLGVLAILLALVSLVVNA